MANDERFKTPADGLEALSSAHHIWTTQLGIRSVAASYAIIGAAWAVYSTKITDHALAIWAIGLAIFYLFLSSGISLCVVELLSNRFQYAQKDTNRWKEEWEHSEYPSDWPYTKPIQWVTKWYHRLKAIMPIVAGLCLILSFVC